MADPKEYNDEKDKRSPGLFRPELGGFKLESRGIKGLLFDPEAIAPCEPGRLDVFSKSCSTAISPTIVSSVVPSNPASLSPESVVLSKFVGRREYAGLYMEEGFVTGGGMEMLALLVFPPIVPTSANRLFRLGSVALLGADSSECEGVRPVDASEGAGLDELAGPGAELGLSVVGSCDSATGYPVADR